ncbi:YbhB/YbcL family Raf kinase inhibitor-like protein [Sphingomonas ginsenosidivorax]|uniref:YbhB/YbcL family Raf kinase inhibitor-like protein n=1 Tax=Sphingomonas ginsenosidivorax TaxID=862135 RepID=A0A5C6UJY4_9SPHN|nr:YbhB/YbcL family Raf kinase inhibitor-like protein [Sphingomonas ginsenosidivorax]TXC72541.1 YbhB/YbcL family Raf kinase inhibitor-like protein [Sphingomonas ginsenosidivorax]
MLEHIPAWLGKAMSGLRAGADKLTIMQLGNRFETLDLTSPAFAHGARLPERFTADGTGVSPPLTWGMPPEGTATLVLIVEDPDAPAPQPLVHAIVWDIAADVGRLAEGAIVADGAGDADGDVGRNSYLREGWLPPDPPSGHGVHDYAFQLFAVGPGAGDPGDTPGRAAVVDAIAGHVLAAGLLIGTYSREDPASVGPVGATASL